jgi:hypothetical protein
VGDFILTDGRTVDVGYCFLIGGRIAVAGDCILRGVGPLILVIVP